MAEGIYVHADNSTEAYKKAAEIAKPDTDTFILRDNESCKKSCQHCGIYRKEDTKTMLRFS